MLSGSLLLGRRLLGCIKAIQKVRRQLDDFGQVSFKLPISSERPFFKAFDGFLTYAAREDKRRAHAEKTRGENGAGRGLSHLW